MTAWAIPKLRLARIANCINVLSIDAVIVAVIWQSFLSLVIVDRNPKAASIAILALTVWLVYVADRLLDAKHLRSDRRQTLRHAFHSRYARTFYCFLAIALAADLWIALSFLTGIQIRLGLVAAALVFVYLGYVHLMPAPRNEHAGQSKRFRICPKECLIGIVFAFGIALPVWQYGFTSEATFSVFLVASLFAANCSLVGLFERDVDRGQEFASLATNGRSIDRTMAWWLFTGIVVSVGFGMIGFVPTAISIGVSGSYLALAVTQFCFRSRQGSVAPGVTIDVATVLIPALIMLVAI